MSASDVGVTVSTKDLLAEAKRHFERGDTEESLSACLAHLSSYPGDPAAIRLKANLFGMEGRLIEAVEAINQVIELVAPSEPCDYFYRGRWLLKNGQTEDACADFRRVIDLSAKYNDTYYAETAHLHLAYAHAMRGDKALARRSLSHIGEECATSVNDSLVTKNYIERLLSA